MLCLRSSSKNENLISLNIRRNHCQEDILDFSDYQDSEAMIEIDDVLVEFSSARWKCSTKNLKEENRSVVTEKIGIDFRVA